MNEQNVIDQEYFMIPRTRYDEMLRKEVERDFLLRIYQNSHLFELMDAMKLVFGLMPEDRESAE